MENASVFRLLIGLSSVLATVACGSAPSKKPMTVAEVISQIDRLNGQTVSVVGYLSRCEPNSCPLYRNKAEADEVDRSMSAMRAALDAGVSDVSGFDFPDHPALGIGKGSRFSLFDMRASFFTNGYVVITGTVSNICYSDGVACLDRRSDLKPSAIWAAATPG
ncbi:hypothetical protein [Sphingomonas lenta]|uniref:hypothetical protein n=1 Tax=Sphingomonas lenta TaxID=1141887 RepID=UPI001596329D|nr:hypothetical protein [Sphingomonas lenta]